jgi:hypothetical protein
MSTGSELSRWVDYAVEVSRQPANAFPTLKLLDMLSETFEATIGWNWLQTDGETGWRYTGPGRVAATGSDRGVAVQHLRAPTAPLVRMHRHHRPYDHRTSPRSDSRPRTRGFRP